MKRCKITGLIRLLFLILFSIQAGIQVHAQKFDGEYKGTFSGDLEGTFEFKVNSAHYANLEGKFKGSDGSVRIIYGRVDEKGVVDAFFYTKQSEVTSAMTNGTFRGMINGMQTEGSYEVYDATREKMSTSKGSWSLQSNTPDEGMFTYTTLLGKDLLISDPKPTALRIQIRLTDKYREKFSIQIVTLESAVTEQGRYAPAKDPVDNFYVYTDMDGVIVRPAAKAKEAVYEFPYASFGNKQELSLPKSFKVQLQITLKGETGEKDRVEKLTVPVVINSLCNVLVQKCAFNECPSLNNKKISKGQTGSAVSGDELVIPMDAEVWVKFLDGTQSYFANKSQTFWRLTLRGGHLTSSQSWGYTENAITIQALAGKGIEAGGDKLLEEGLQVLMRKGASVATPGLILQLSQLFGANVAGGELVAIRVRSKLDIMFYANGTFRIRNLEGSPEIVTKKGTPMKIPVGKEVMVDRKGLISPPVQIPAGPAEPPVTKILETASWQGTWQTQWGQMVIEQNGNSITGTYVHDNGKIKGTISGTLLKGTWSEAPSYLAPRDAGEFEFTLSADGKAFTGRWRYGKNGDWQTGWDGHK